MSAIDSNKDDDKIIGKGEGYFDEEDELSESENESETDDDDKTENSESVVDEIDQNVEETNVDVNEGDNSDVDDEYLDEDDKPKVKPSEDLLIELPGKTDITKLIENIYEEDDDEDVDEDYFKKFDRDTQKTYLLDFHPESKIQNYDEIMALSRIVRDDNGIYDSLHKTIPYLTKFEKARILGQRAKQLNHGAQTFIQVSDELIDGYSIALTELREKRIPFIIRRPLPNGSSEYWKVSDLEDII